MGLDAHKEALNVAMLLPGQTRPVEWQTSNDQAAVRRMVRKVQRAAQGEVRFCYEAGPCGYALQRWIRAMEVVCVVVAPSLIPRKSGERVKTDRRDARKLAELFRAGLLTDVHPPTEEDEAVRDLCRAREDAHADLVGGRHRLSKLLLRRGWAWTGGKKMWGQGHRLWLRSLRFEHREDQWVLDDYLLAIENIEERLRGLDAQVEQVSQDSRYARVVGALRCFRGIDTLTAMCLVAELALEESGCEVQELEFICEYLVSPGGTSERISLYCGRVDSSHAGGIHGLAEESEDIRVSAVPFTQAGNGWRRGLSIPPARLSPCSGCTCKKKGCGCGGGRKFLRRLQTATRHNSGCRENYVLNIFKRIHMVIGSLDLES